MGVRLLAPTTTKPVRALLDDVAASRVTHVVALGGSAPVDPGSARRGDGGRHRARRDCPSRRLAVVSFASARRRRAWAEQTGTYVNAKGIRQMSEKALEPQGIGKSPPWRSSPTSRWRRSGTEPSWTKLRQVHRAKLLGATAGAGDPCANGDGRRVERASQRRPRRSIR